MNTLSYIRWLFACFSGLLWLGVAIYNGWIAWRLYVKKDAPDAIPSFIPFAGIFFLDGVYQLTPWGTPDNRIYFLSMLLIDLGSWFFPICYVFPWAIRKIRFERDAVGQYIASSWLIKWGGGIIGWIAFVPIVSSLTELSIDINNKQGGLSFLSLTAVYWILHTLLFRHLNKKYDKIEDKDDWRRRFAGKSLAIKLGAGIFIWLVFLLIATIFLEVFEIGYTTGFYAVKLISLVYWILFILFIISLRERG